MRENEAQRKKCAMLARAGTRTNHQLGRGMATVTPTDGSKRGGRKKRTEGRQHATRAPRQARRIERSIEPSSLARSTYARPPNQLIIAKTVQNAPNFA
uniref:Uncharacterized protein n=1 Tax=Panagrellus redivivus TaxID=6233 RepID=A0A7E4V177_PANRE